MIAALAVGLLVPAAPVAAAGDGCLDGRDAGPGNGGGSSPKRPDFSCSGALGGSDEGDAYNIRVPYNCWGGELIPANCYVHTGHQNGLARDADVTACKKSGSPDHWHAELQWFPSADGAAARGDTEAPGSGENCVSLSLHWDNTPTHQLRGTYYVAVEATGTMEYHLDVKIVH